MNEAMALSIRIYRKLARAFPEEFRRAHGNELVQTTEDLIYESAKRRGVLGLILLMFRILADLAIRVPIEHAAELWQDTRYASRRLMASPAFAVAAVLSVGCGIGMGTSVFSQLDGFIFRPVPAISDSPSLVAVRAAVSFPVYESFRDQSEQFSDIAAYIGPVPLARNDTHPTVRHWGQFVTPNFFEVLGTKMQAGRAFSSDESSPGIEPVAVISDRFWREQMSSGQDVVGKTVRLNGRIVTVIGVAAHEFQGPSPLMNSADIWIPVTTDPAFAPELGGNVLADKKRGVFSVLGRLRPGVVQSEAEAKLDTLAKQINDAKPGSSEVRGRQVALLPGGRRLPIRDSDLPTMIAVPSVLVGLMLWITCSNVGTILLARSHARRKEIAVRLSLGASRSRLIRQLLTESVLLAVLGGIAGFLIAVWMQNWSNRYMKDFFPSFVDFNVTLDWKALLFTFGLSLLSGIMFGLTPALQATRSDLTQSLKPGSSSRLGSFRWFGARNMLVLQQVAGSLMLLLITGFVVLGIQRTSSVDPGFDSRNLYMMSVDPLRDGYSPDEAETWFARIRERVKRLPGVAEAGLAYYAPVGPRSKSADIRFQSDMNSIQQTLKSISVERVGLGYFETTGLAILHGRSFVESDTGGNRVVVNETMAKQIWPGQVPLGRDVEIDGKHFEVIGVVKDINGGGVFAIPTPGAFQMMTPEDYRRPAAHGMVVMIRGMGGVDVIGAVRQDLASTDSDLTIFNAGSVREEIDRALYLVRATMLIYGGMGFFGLILAAVGLAGVTSYAVVQRTKEIGIRLALGATKTDVLKLVVREGAILVIVGTVIGQALAWGLTRALSSWFNGLGDMTKTSTNDPLLLFGAPVLLAGLTMIACYLPARRSIHIDPAITLREE